MTWLQGLLDNTLFQALLAIIAIVGFVYAFIVQRVNKEKKELSYVKKSNTLIREKKSKYEKLSIAYAGHQIESLCVSNIALWSSGNRTLNDTDIVESKEVTITAADGNVILDVEIIAYSEETNNFSMKKINDHCVKGIILFDIFVKRIFYAARQFSYIICYTQTMPSVMHSVVIIATSYCIYSILCCIKHRLYLAS